MMRRLKASKAPAVIRKKALSRRAMLRGIACTGAVASIRLPWLDAMRPALASRLVGNAAAPKPHAVFVFAPNGMDMDAWYGKPEAGPPLLQPLAGLRSRLLVPHNLRLWGAFAQGDGPGDHARAAASFLTTAHPFKTGGNDIHNGESVDQALARAWEGTSRFRSLELGMARGRSSGACDSGYACAYSSHISWRGPTTPVPAETQPREVFLRLFGDPGDILDPEERARQDLARRSVLDAVTGHAKELRRELGGGDRDRLDQYLEAVRDLEKRLQEGHDGPEVRPPSDLDKGDYQSRLGVMYELIALALQSRQTRVVSFMLGTAGSGQTYRWLDVPEGHHYLSHHKNDPKKIAKIRKINRWHMEQFAAFAQRMADTPTPEGDLLSQGTVLLGSGIADGNRHRHDDLPVLLAGEMGGRVPVGKSIEVAKKTSMGDLYLSILRAGGVPAQSFGDSKGPLFT